MRSITAHRSLLDEVVDPTTLLAFCPLTEKSQMVVQPVMLRKLSDDLNVPVTGDPPLAILLGFEFHE